MLLVPEKRKLKAVKPQESGKSYLNSKHMLLGGMWYVGTVGVAQGYGAWGTVVRCRGYGGYGGGVRWVRWRGAVGNGGVRWVRWMGAVGTVGTVGTVGKWARWTVGAVEGGYRRMVEK